MAKRVVSQRHRPSFKSYLRHNITTSFSMSAKARAMVTLGFLILSVLLGSIGGLIAPRINATLGEMELRVALGIVVFLFFQFGLFTPFRMWRDANWVTNIETILGHLWDCHEKGVKLLNEHHYALRSDPKLADNSSAKDEFLDRWYKDLDTWSDQTEAEIAKLSPLEARRFRYVVVVTPEATGGFDQVHNLRLSTLVLKLRKLEAVDARHQPALSPE